MKRRTLFPNKVFLARMYWSTLRGKHAFRIRESLSVRDVKSINLDDQEVAFLPERRTRAETLTTPSGITEEGVKSLQIAVIRYSAA